MPKPMTDARILARIESQLSAPRLTGVYDLLARLNEFHNREKTNNGNKKDVLDLAVAAYIDANGNIINNPNPGKLNQFLNALKDYYDEQG